LAVVAVVAMALTTKNPVVALMLPLAAPLPYLHPASRPSLLLAVLAVKTQVVVAVLTVLLVSLPASALAALVDH
jgi:hypothetical protein